MRPSLGLLLSLIMVQFAALSSSTAQQKPTTELIPRSVLFGNPERADPQISPDGTQLGYLAPVDGVLNVWVRTLGKTDDRAVTVGHQARHSQLHSGNTTISTSSIPRTWAATKTGGSTRPTSPPSRPRTSRRLRRCGSTSSAYDWRTPDTILFQSNQRDPQLFDVYSLDLKTGKIAMNTQNPGDVAGWQADNDLKVRAAQVSTPDGGTIIRVRNEVSRPWRELIKWGPDETFGGVFGFTPDNKSIWVGTSLDANAARLLEIDIATGARKVIAADPQFDIQGLVTQPKTNALEVVTFVKQRTEYDFIDPKIKADYQVLQKAHEGDIISLSRSLDDNKWIVTYVTDDGPIYYYLYDRPAKQATMLFTNRPALEKYQLAKMEPIEYTARDGMKIYGYLTTPAGETGEESSHGAVCARRPVGPRRMGLQPLRPMAVESRLRRAAD